MTSAEQRYGPTYTAGSPQYQSFYDKNEQQIVCWMHGHTHMPKHRTCEKVVNPGAFEYGNLVIVEIVEI